MLRLYEVASSLVFVASFTAVVLVLLVMADMSDSPLAEQPLASAGLALGACGMYELLLRDALNELLLRRLRREVAIRERNLTPPDRTSQRAAARPSRSHVLGWLFNLAALGSIGTGWLVSGSIRLPVLAPTPTTGLWAMLAVFGVWLLSRRWLAAEVRQSVALPTGASRVGALTAGALDHRTVRRLRASGAGLGVVAIAMVVLAVGTLQTGTPDGFGRLASYRGSGSPTPGLTFVLGLFFAAAAHGSLTGLRQTLRADPASAHLSVGQAAVAYLRWLGQVRAALLLLVGMLIVGSSLAVTAPGLMSHLPRQLSPDFVGLVVGLGAYPLIVREVVRRGLIRSAGPSRTPTYRLTPEGVIMDFGYPNLQPVLVRFDELEDVRRFSSVLEARVFLTSPIVSTRIRSLGSLQNQLDAVRQEVRFVQGALARPSVWIKFDRLVDQHVLLSGPGLLWVMGVDVADASDLIRAFERATRHSGVGVESPGLPGRG